MSRIDPEGDELKTWERKYETVYDGNGAIILRLDGRAFHSWTRCLTRPYDPRMHELMCRTMLRVAREFHARYCYTQSDEISLVLFREGKGEWPFGGRLQKLVSVSASLAGVTFQRAITDLGIQSKVEAMFDCRAYAVPYKATAAKVILWREADAIRNSSLGRGQEFLSHKEMQGLSAREVRGRLRIMDKAWGDLPPERKFGTAYARRVVRRPFRSDEIGALPPNHKARKDPTLVVERQDYLPVDLPLRWLAANPAEVIFNGAEIAPRERAGGEDDEVLT